MREIKFRAWHKGAKTMLYVGDKYGTEHHLDCARYAADGQPVHLMQYTGLKDRSGKEIYEGDILDIAGGGVRSVIEWNPENAAFCSASPKGGEQSDHLYGVDIYKIIGNIYENPELLRS